MNYKLNNAELIDIEEAITLVNIKDCKHCKKIIDEAKKLERKVIIFQPYGHTTEFHAIGIGEKQ